MNNQVRTVILQWITPTVFMIIILAIMMYNFSAKSKLTAKNTVTRNMTDIALDSARDFSQELVALNQVGRPIAALLEKESGLDTEHAVELVEVARLYAGAYEAWVCDEDGNGIDNTGKSVSLKTLDCVNEILAAGELAYLYSEKSGTGSGNTIITVVPFAGEEVSGRLLLFYSLANFKQLVSSNDYSIWNMEILIDAEGDIIFASGTATPWVTGDNLFDRLQENNGDAVTAIRRGLNNSSGAMVSVKMDGAENALVYVPVPANGWMLILGTTQGYIDRLVLSQYQSFQKMLYQLLAANIVFLCIIIGANIVSKVYGNKKQQQLEIKADTDLLTGLNNKLATERKIKEFIQHNPDAQSMMFVLDIDNFKKINDTMGHAFGDVVLSTLGHSIGMLFRATDIVGRAGGDEFIIFLKNISTPDIIRKEAKKVENFFKDFKAGEYTKYKATASIGVAIYPQEGADFESIYKAADQALYKAKKRGKNQLAYYHDEWAEEKPE